MLQGLPTEGQLRDRFQDVARAARGLALLPEGGVGPISVGLSKLASKLKVQPVSSSVDSAQSSSVQDTHGFGI